MIDTGSPGPQKIEWFEKFLGTPSAQKIIALLSCWKALPSKEIVDKTELSESQVHDVLTKLQQIDVIEKKSRGIYALSNKPFSNHLRKAYQGIIEQSVGNTLYFLSKNIDTLPLEEVEKRWTALIDQWEPYLKKHFSHQLSSLSGHLVDRLS